MANGSTTGDAIDIADFTWLVPGNGYRWVQERVIGDNRRPERRAEWVLTDGLRDREWGGVPAEELKGREEHVVFSLPRALRAATSRPN